MTPEFLEDVRQSAAIIASRGLVYGDKKDITNLAAMIEGLAQYLQQKDKTFTEQWEPLLRMKRGENNG